MYTCKMLSSATWFRLYLRATRLGSDGERLVHSFACNNGDMPNVVTAEACLWIYRVFCRCGDPAECEKLG